ncbi:DUF4133 domain-containing protein [Segetibacter koreensis]|uniref:DUF4133 domain-containing protein n=1 Tax=Segetibacter koreensis TaxID=398037 RepID=UPI0003699788|nr:DUF4133 domain-containing protein [Segetibacter koreensis]
MSNSVYQINKGINRPIEFKGLKAQYIWYLATGLVGLLILFAILYIIGINPFICVGTILILGIILILKVYAASNKYGEHGMMKKLAHKSIPNAIRSNSRKTFMKLSLHNGKISR